MASYKVISLLKQTIEGGKWCPEIVCGRCTEGNLMKLSGTPCILEGATRELFPTTIQSKDAELSLSLPMEQYRQQSNCLVMCNEGACATTVHFLSASSSLLSWHIRLQIAPADSTQKSYFVRGISGRLRLNMTWYSRIKLKCLQKRLSPTRSDVAKKTCNKHVWKYKSQYLFLAKRMVLCLKFRRCSHTISICQKNLPLKLCLVLSFLLYMPSLLCILSP